MSWRVSEKIIDIPLKTKNLFLFHVSGEGEDNKTQYFPSTKSEVRKNA